MISLTRYYNVLWISNPKTYIKDGLSFTMKLQQTHVPGLEVLKFDFPMAFSFTEFNRPVFIFLSHLLNKLISRIYLTVLERRLKNICSLDESCLYVWRPEYFHYASSLSKHSPKCYHLDDEYSFNLKEDIPVSNVEKNALINSDVVFIHSKSLMEKKGCYNSNSIILPNAVSSNYFKSLKELTASREIMDSAIFESKKPVIGYVGQIKRQLDFELLFELTCTFPYYDFVFIGRVNDHEEVHAGWLRILRQSNVYYLGEKKSTELPYYIKNFDVAIMPYLNNVYTKYIFPLKLYEYMACGCQIVSTNLPNLSDYHDFIFLNENIADWKNSINAILEHGEVKIGSGALIELASRNTWESRAQRVMKELSYLL